MLRNWLAAALYRASDRLRWLGEWCWDAAVWTAHRDSWSSIRARRRRAKKNLPTAKEWADQAVDRARGRPPGGNPLGWGRGPGVR